MGDDKAAKVLHPWRVVFETVKAHTAKRSQLPETSNADAEPPGARTPPPVAEEEKPDFPAMQPLSESLPVSQQWGQNTSNKLDRPSLLPKPRTETNPCYSAARESLAAAVGHNPNENPWDPGPRNLTEDPKLHPLKPMLRQESLKQDAPAVPNSGVLRAFPVFMHPRQPAYWEPVPYPLIKDLRKSVIDYGLSAPFTMGVLDNLFNSFVLTPHDCSSIAKMTLSTVQFALFEDEWRSLAKKPAEGILAANGMPVADSINRLMGEGPYADVAVQPRMPLLDLNLAKDLALQAFHKISNTTAQSPSFTTVLQGLREPFYEFANRLRDAINKQIDNKLAQDALFQKLAIEQANPECQKILRGMREPTITEMIQVCNYVSSQAPSPAAPDPPAGVLMACKQPSAPRCQEPCYECGQLDPRQPALQS